MRIAFCVLIIVMIPVALLFFGQHSLVYHARRYPPGYRDGLPPRAVELHYSSSAGEQVAFYLPPRSGAAVPARVWVMFSGNASLALDWLFVTERNPSAADAYLLIDYPGYGASARRASIANTRESAEKAMALLAEQMGLSEADLAQQLCVFGVSLGAAAALEFSAAHSLQRAVIIAPFTTLREEAATLFLRPLSYLVRENYDNRTRLRQLAARPHPPRVAIFHGTSDSLIPPRMGQELAATVPAIAQFFAVAGATHDTIVSEALPQILSWMND